MTTKKKISEPTPSAYAGAVPTIEIGAGEFKNRCLQLLDEVKDLTVEIVVTKHGVPVARLVAPDIELASAFGFMRGTVLDATDIVAPDFEAWGDQV